MSFGGTGEDDLNKEINTHEEEGFTHLNMGPNEPSHMPMLGQGSPSGQEYPLDVMHPLIMIRSLGKTHSS